MQEDNSNIIFKYLTSFPYYVYSFLHAIYNLIRPEDTLNNDNHASDVVDFIASFEQRYGPRRPKFLMTDYVTSINKAKSSLRFLLLYLHGDDHEDSDYFCRNTLCSNIFLDYLDQIDVIFWGCNINSVEGFTVSKIVREHSYPFIGVVTIDANSRMYLVGRHEGMLAVDSLMLFISETLAANAAGVVACKAQREGRQLNHELRQQQEEDYAACLRIDHERESLVVDAERAASCKERLLEKESQENGRFMRQWRQRREETQGLLPAQPLNGDRALSIVLRIKFPSGTVSQRTFYLTDSMKLLFYWIFSLEECPRDFSVFTNFPKREIFCRPSELELGSAVIHRGPREGHRDPVSFGSAGLLTSMLLYVVDNSE